MKNIQKQTKIAAFLLGALLFAPQASARAMESTIHNPYITAKSSSTSTVQPRADVIVNKYRMGQSKLSPNSWM